MTVLSLGMFLISSCDIKMIVSVPVLPPQPWARWPSSLHIAFVHTVCMSGSFANFLYFMIVSFVTGCTSPLHVCSSCASNTKVGCSVLSFVGVKAFVCAVWRCVLMTW